ncbi:MAG TPA: hypothetical protein P5539_13765 [Mesotoga sp.]|nr:hypothetical protein [Mesotoga sp.]
MLLEGNFVPFEELPQIVKEAYDVENVALLFKEAAESKEDEMPKEKELLNKLMEKIGHKLPHISPPEILQASSEIPELEALLTERATYRTMLYLLDTSGTIPQTIGFAPRDKVIIHN